MIRVVKSVALMCLVLLPGLGCNTSRYGVTHDQRLPQIKRVAIVPMGVGIFSWHAGGDKELRVDYTTQVRPGVLADTEALVRKKGFEPVIVDPGLPELPASQPVLPAVGVALGIAVRDAIHTHHYQYGKALFFDHGIGRQATESIAADQQADAVLVVGLTAAVPTGSRIALKITALVVGGLLGAHNFVQTNESFMTMMLVDARTGEVLWYNEDLRKSDPRSHSQLRDQVKSTGAYLLKPRKG